MSINHISTRISERVRRAAERSRERRDHDRAMADPGVRNEHFIARSRHVSAGGQDCPFCA